MNDIEELRDDLHQAQDQLNRVEDIAGTLLRPIDEDAIKKVLLDGMTVAAQSYDIIEALDSQQDLIYWYSFKAMSDYITNQVITGQLGYWALLEEIKSVIAEAHQDITPGSAYRLPASFHLFMDSHISRFHQDVKAEITAEARQTTLAALQDLSDLLNEDL